MSVASKSGAQRCDDAEKLSHHHVLYFQVSQSTSCETASFIPEITQRFDTKNSFLLCSFGSEILRIILAINSNSVKNAK